LAEATVRDFDRVGAPELGGEVSLKLRELVLLDGLGMNSMFYSSHGRGIVLCSGIGLLEGLVVGELSHASAVVWLTASAIDLLVLKGLGGWGRVVAIIYVPRYLNTHGVPSVDVGGSLKLDLVNGIDSFSLGTTGLPEVDVFQELVDAAFMVAVFLLEPLELLRLVAIRLSLMVDGSEQFFPLP
jgi:hypothetical protein